MGCVIGLLLVLGRFVLGLAVFAGLLHLLVISNFTLRSVNSDTYYLAISDTGAYNRIYSEVLVDEVLSDQVGNLLGDIDIQAHEETVEVLREVLPPAYLQEQTEDNIDRFTSFLRYDRENLEIYASLKEPLERVEPAVLGKVHQLIDELDIEDPVSGDCSMAASQKLASASAAPYSQLSDGEIPDSAPSLKILTPVCREQEFDRWLDRVLDDPAINSQTALILEAERANLRRHFVEGDTRKFLKAVTDPLVKPLIDDAIADIRRNLQRDDRFDLLDWLAEQSDDASRGRHRRASRVPAGNRKRCQRPRQNHRAGHGGAGLPADGPDVPAQPGGDAALAGHHPSDGRWRLPDSRVCAELGRPRTVQGCDSSRSVLLSQRARFGNQLGRRHS